MNRFSLYAILAVAVGLFATPLPAQPPVGTFGGSQGRFFMSNLPGRNSQSLGLGTLYRNAEAQPSRLGRRYNRSRGYRGMSGFSGAGSTLSSPSSSRSFGGGYGSSFGSSSLSNTARAGSRSTGYYR